MFTDFLSITPEEEAPTVPTIEMSNNMDTTIPALAGANTPLISSTIPTLMPSPSTTRASSAPAPLQQQAYALLAQRPPQSVFAFTDNLKDLLALTPIQHVAPTHPDKKWHALLTTTSVQLALENLKAYDLLSMPVLDPTTNLCLGFVDVVDLMGYLFYVCAQPVPSNDLSLLTLTRIFEIYSNEPVSKVIDFSKRNPLVSVMSSENLLGLLRSLKTVHGLSIHRFAVTHPGSSEIVQILSQSDIVRYIAKHISVLGMLDI